jgi:ring-1,2-phenylacetyl-CoA epoxidase subunit PaaD
VVSVAGPTEPVERARAAAGAVVDPELPVLTLADLGVLGDVEADGDTVVVELVPTYTGCPALETIAADVRRAVREAGFGRVEVRLRLAPPWSTDLITDRGRALLCEHGIAPPAVGAARNALQGPVDLLLGTAAPPDCPRCGSSLTREVSRFGPTACTSLHVCTVCLEPFEKVKER